MPSAPPPLVAPPPSLPLVEAAPQLAAPMPVVAGADGAPRWVTAVVAICWTLSVLGLGALGWLKVQGRW